MNHVEAIIVHTAAIFGHTPAELVSRSRKQPIVIARQAAMWAVRQRYPSIPLATIGEVVGDRHYTTVMHALAAVEERAEQDTAYRELLRSLLERVAVPPGRARGFVHSASQHASAWWRTETRAPQP